MKQPPRDPALFPPLPRPPEDSEAWSFPPPAPRAPRPRTPPPQSRPWLHALLLCLTFLTLVVAGALWAEAPSGAVPADLLDPARLPALLAGPLQYAFWVLLILGAHEMGHYLACRRYGIPATLPFFIPGIPPLGSFGAVIRIRGAIPDRRALFDIAAAGPIAGFAIALPVLLAGYLGASPLDPAGGDGMGGLIIGEPLVLRLFAAIWPPPGAGIRANALIGAGWVGMLVTSLNLFPVGQLDGGHAVYAVSRRLHRWMAWGVLLALLALVLYQALALRQAPAYLLWFALLLYMRNRHPRLLDERAPLGRGRALLALVLLLIFLLSFIPVPLSYADGSP